MQEEFEVKAKLCVGQQEWWVVIVVVAEVEALRVRGAAVLLLCEVTTHTPWCVCG